MRATFSILFFILCLNLTLIALIKLEVPPYAPIVVDVEHSEEELEKLARWNATAQKLTADPRFINIPFLGHILAAFDIFIGTIDLVLFGYNYLLLDMGCPDVIVWIINILIGVIITWEIVGFIVGRETTQ